MRPTRLLKTAAFRLAFLLALLFSVLTASQFALVYWDFSRFARTQLRTTIEEEAAKLAKEAEDEGIDHLADNLRAALARSGGHAFEYALYDAAGVRTVGALQLAHPAPGWQEVPMPAEEADETGEPAVALAVPLADGSLLVVAKDTDEFVDLRERIASTMAVGSGVTVLLALIGGTFLSWRSLHRIETVNRTAGRIMGGDFSERLPDWRSGDEFDRLAKILNRLFRRIERLVQDLRQVSSDIAHDLRTPLARLRQGLEELSGEAAATPELEAGIARAVAQVDDILGTFTALLRIAEVEAGARAAGFTTVDLSELAGRMRDTYQAVVEDSGRSFTCAIAERLQVRGDPELLTQMLANLIENALRHTPQGSRVSLGLTRRGEAAVLSVADDGPGIPPEMRAAVLERFARLDLSRSSPGHGLGLALVAAVAELHGATLTLGDARPGLLVEILIPLAGPAAPDRGGAPAGP